MGRIVEYSFVLCIFVRIFVRDLLFFATLVNSDYWVNRAHFSALLFRAETIVDFHVSITR